MDSPKIDVRLSVLETRFNSCNDKLDEHTALLEKILSAVHGNGKPGIKTKTELNEAGLRRLWWVVSLGFPASVTIIVFILNFMARCR